MQKGSPKPITQAAKGAMKLAAQAMPGPTGPTERNSAAVAASSKEQLTCTEMTNIQLEAQGYLIVKESW